MHEELFLISIFRVSLKVKLAKQIYINTFISKRQFIHTHVLKTMTCEVMPFLCTVSIKMRIFPGENMGASRVNLDRKSMKDTCSGLTGRKSIFPSLPREQKV